MEKPNETTPQAEIQFTYYSSPLYLAYFPEGWAIDDQKTAPGVVRFAAPVSSGNELSPEFLLHIWEGNESTPEDFEAYEKNLLLDGDVILKKDSVFYKNKDAFMMEYEGKDAETGSQIHFKTIMFKNEKWVYRLHYSMEKSDLEKYQPIMESILDKFVIGSG